MEFTRRRDSNVLIGANEISLSIARLDAAEALALTKIQSGPPSAISLRIVHDEVPAG